MSVRESMYYRNEKQNLYKPMRISASRLPERELEQCPFEYA